MTVADNEGNGIPQTPIYRLLPGKDYGFTPSTTGNPTTAIVEAAQSRSSGSARRSTRSAGSQVWVPDDNAGARSPGQLLHTSYGNCALFSVLIDKKAEPWQGRGLEVPARVQQRHHARPLQPDGRPALRLRPARLGHERRQGRPVRPRPLYGKRPTDPLRLSVERAASQFTFSAPLDKKPPEDDDNWAGTWLVS